MDVRELERALTLESVHILNLLEYMHPMSSLLFNTI